MSRRKQKAEAYGKGIMAYCHKVRKMSRDGTIGYLDNIEDELLNSEAKQAVRLDETDEKIKVIRQLLKEQKEFKNEK